VIRSLSDHVNLYLSIERATEVGSFCGWYVRGFSGLPKGGFHSSLAEGRPRRSLVLRPQVDRREQAGSGPEYAEGKRRQPAQADGRERPPGPSGFNLTYIDKDFPSPASSGFDTRYMRALYQYGYDKAKTGDFWAKAPPSNHRLPNGFRSQRSAM